MAEKLRNFGLPSNLFAYRGGHQNSFEIEYEQIQSTLEIDTGKQQKQQQRRRPCFVLIPENDYHLLRKIIGTSDNDDNQQQQSDDFNLDGKYCRIVTNWPHDEYIKKVCNGERVWNTHYIASILISISRPEPDFFFIRTLKKYYTQSGNSNLSPENERMKSWCFSPEKNG